MDLMPLRGRSRGFMRANHLFIHNYIRSFLNIILRSILMVLTMLELASYCLYVGRISQLIELEQHR